MKNLIKIIFIFLLISYNIYAKSLEKVTLKLQWLDQFQFAGYYIAKEKGFYEKLGLDVEILKYQFNDKNIIDDVISGKATYATGRTSLLIHENNGKPVVAIAAIFQHAPDVLLVTNKNINTPKDLKNKKIMISSDAISSASYMSMLFSEGIKKEDLIIQKHSYNVNDLIAEKTDAIASYISNEPYKLEKKGITYKYFNPKDYGFDFYGDILYTSKKELIKNPNRVKNFTSASLKGWHYAFENIEETAKLIYEKYNAQKKTLDELIYEGKTLKKLAYDENNEIGHIDNQRFEEIAKVYRLLGLIKKDYNLDDFIYNAHCKYNFILTKEEKDWLDKNREIRLGIDTNWQPIEFLNDDGEYSGITAGYKKLIEEKLDIKLIIEKNDYWYKTLNNLKDDEIDMFLAVVQTPKREKYMNFTKPYLNFPAVIVTQDNVGYIKELNQLSFKTVALEKGFYTEELLKELNKNIKILHVDTTQEALKKVYDGSAYAYIGTLPTLGYFIKKQKYTNLKINGEAPFKTKLSFATRKELTILNNILEKTLSSITQKEHDEIYNKWINIEYVHSIDSTIVLIILLICVIILLLLYIRTIELKNISETDSLTKIPNRRKLDNFLKIEMERSIRSSHFLTIAFIDIDFFKTINDTYGHKTGDEILIKISKILKENTRKYELIGRWGGEEFLLICPNNSISQTASLCRKLQDLIGKIKIKKNIDDKITVSCGIAEYLKDESLDKFIQRADNELYKAKENGRNCIFPKV